MEATAVNKLIEKAYFHSEAALAIAEAMDITITAHNFVTVPMMEIRFAALETKLEARFTAIMQSIADAKVSAIKLYVALVVILFGTLTADHHYLIGRVDQLEVRSEERFRQVDERFKQVDTRFQQIDQRFAQVDKRFEQVDKRFEQVDTRLQQMDAKLEDIRALLTGRRGHKSRS